MTSRQERETIRSLAALIYKRESSIMSGQTKLSLTTNSLTVLSAGFLKLSDVECVDNCQVVIASSPMLMELQYLRQSLRKLPALKVIHGTCTIQGRVDLTNMTSLRHLEVKKAPIHLLEGLRVLRGQLLSITCSRCVQNLQDVFVSCGGDMSSAEVWPNLKAACLSSNGIEQLDGSLRYLPVLEYLDLSYNHLVTTMYYLQLLSDLEHINLGYNELSKVPSFSSAVSARLRTLILRNNNLDNIDGIEALTGLRELDLCENCLADHVRLEGLLNLHHIKSLNLCGNPLFYHVNHRPLTMQYLSSAAVRDKSRLKQVWLDGKLITDTDRLYVARDPVYFEAPPGGEGQEPRPTCSKYDETFDTIHQKVEAQIHHHDPNLTLIPRDQQDNVSRDSANGDSDTGTKSGTNRKRKPKRRNVVITTLESDADTDTSVSREASRGVSPFKPSSSLNDREEYEAARKQLGPDWLVTVNEKYFPANRKTSPATSQDSANRSMESSASQNVVEQTPTNQSGPFAFVGSPIDPSNDLEQSQGSQTNDLVLKTSISEEVKVDWSWSEDKMEDEDIDGEPYIVTQVNGNKMMAILGNNVMWETSISNKAIEKFDLRSLVGATTDDSAACAIRLSFDTLRADRKQRIYIMEDHKHAQQFLDCVSPFVLRHAERNTDIGTLLCMKCNNKFAHSSKSGGAASCPQCGGGIVIHVDDVKPSQGEAVFGSVVSTDGMLTPLAASSAHTSPSRTNDSGDNVSYRSLVDTDTVGSIQSAASFKSIDETDQSLSSFQENFIPRNQSQSSLYGARNQSESTSYMTADNRSIGSSQSYETLRSSGASFSDNSVAVINGFQLQGPDSGDATPKVAQRMNTMTRPAFPSVNELEAVTSCPGLAKTVVSQGHQESRFHERSRLDSEESDITVISNPSLSSITVLQNPSRDLQANGRPDQVRPRSYSLDRGKTLSEIMGTQTDDVITDRENMALGTSPCGSLTTKTVTSMVDSMYERNLSPNGSTDRSTSIEAKVKETTESRHPSVTLQEYVYNYEDYSAVDHRIKLWMAMSVLEEMEESQLLLRCDVCQFGKEDMVPSLFVVTNSRIHFYKIIGPERGQPSEWLMVLGCYAKTSVRYVDIGYNYQWFQVELPDLMYALVIRDEIRCKNFLTSFTAVLQDNALSTRSELRGITKNQESTMRSLQALCEQEGDESVVKRLFAAHAVSGKGESIPVSMVITAERLYLMDQNYDLPGPRAFSQSVTSRRPQFTVIEQRPINDISCLNVYADAPLSIFVSFFSEDVTSSDNSDWSSSLMVTMATPNALMSLVEAIRIPWEAEFGVELQIKRQSVSPRRGEVS